MPTPQQCLSYTPSTEPIRQGRLGDFISWLVPRDRARANPATLDKQTQRRASDKIAGAKRKHEAERETTPERLPPTRRPPTTIR